MIRTIASVGSSIVGSGTSSTRTSRLPCQVTAFIASSRRSPVPWAVPRNGGAHTRRGRPRARRRVYRARARAASRRGSERPRRRRPRRASPGGRDLHGLRPLPRRDPDGVRRGAGFREAGDRSASNPAIARIARGARSSDRPDGSLDELLDDAGIDREVAYLTNAVKHFKWIAKGKRRIHQRPDAAEIAACRPWLEAELDRLGPEVLLCLGATAARRSSAPRSG